MTSETFANHTHPYTTQSPSLVFTPSLKRRVLPIAGADRRSPDAGTPTDRPSAFPLPPPGLEEPCERCSGPRQAVGSAREEEAGGGEGRLSSLCRRRRKGEEGKGTGGTHEREAPRHPPEGRLYWGLLGSFFLVVL